MKKLLIILLIFTAFTSSAQVYQRDPAYGRSIDRYEVLKDLGIPTFCGTPTVNSTVTNKAKIAYDSCGHVLYKYDPSTGLWSAASGSADLSNYYSKTQIDSIFSLIGVYNLDGLISGGIVSWTGSGLSFNVSASEFRKFGIIYTTPDTTITLDAADVTYSRIDLFALDTTNGGEVIKITGTPAPTPVAPQVLDYQIALTTGITLNVGDTVPANVSIQKIYDENIEWATSQNGSVTVNFNDVSNPFSGTKDALISSYGDIGRIVFTRSGTGVMDGSEVLKMHISLRDTLKAGRYIRVLFLNNSTPLSSSIVPITKNNGLDPNIVNQYQTIQMPASYFQFTSTTYNRLIIYATGYDTSGTGGFYLDDVELQSGINNVPSQTDISGKVNYTDSGKIYVTPTQLAALHNNLNVYKPLYGVAADTSLHVYTETDSTLADNSDTTLPTTKAVKAYVDNRAVGGGSWGSITGTLSSQTDLQSALDAKLPISDTTNKWLQNAYIRNDSLFKVKNNTESFVGRIDTSLWAKSGTAIYNKNGNVLIGTSTDDGHKFRLVGTMSVNIGSDAAGDTYYRDSLGTFTRLPAPTGFTKPVLGFKSGYPKWQEDSVGSGSSGVGDSITSFSKNATKDSIILVTNKARYAVKDSIGGGAAVYYDTAVAASGNVNWNVTMPGITSYYKGLTVYAFFNTASTGFASTININGIGSVLMKFRSTNVATNEIANQTLELVYDGTYFQIMNYDYSVLPKTNITNTWTASQAMSGGITALGGLTTYSQNFRGNIWMGNGSGITSTTWSYYQESGNNVFMRTGFLGADNVAAAVTSGYDFANVLLGKTTASKNGGTHALWSNLAVLTDSATGTGTITDAQNIYVGDAPTVGTNNYSINAGYSRFRAPIQTKGYTVATLPTGHVGDMTYVTDASSPSYLTTVTGGGSVVCPVFFNGTNWVAH